MYQRFAFAGLCALFVGACGATGGEAGNASGNETASPAASRAGGTLLAETMKPGQWQVRDEGDVDGTEGLCITAEQLREASFVGDSLQDQEQCSVVRDRMAGGVIDVQVACGTGRHPMTMRGTYTADTFELDTSLEIPTGEGTETIRVRRAGRWVADQCTAEDGESASDTGDESGNVEG